MIVKDPVFGTEITVKFAEEDALPSGAYGLVLAKNGLFIKREHEFFKSCVPARDFPFEELADQATYCQIKLPKIRQVTMEKIVGFFDAVYKKYKAEAGVILYYNAEKKLVMFSVPKQQVNANEMKYKEGVKHLEGMIRFGTVHSHGGHTAYSSPTDEKDEEYQTGLHITIGDVDKEPPTFHAEYIVDGVRFGIRDVWDVVEGYEKRNKDVPKEFMKQVKKLSWWKGGGVTSGYSGGYWDEAQRRWVHKYH